MSRRGKKGILAFILLVLGILIMGVSGYKLISQHLDYRRSNILYENLNDKYVSADNDSGDTEAKQEKPAWVKEFKIDLAGLQKENPDCIGWLYQENSDQISYPIMYSGDDSYYLHATPDKKYALAGSIFVEGENNPDFSDSHTIIYGHNMRNLSMFGSLKFYHDKGYYEEHPYFQIRTGEKAMRYRVFAYGIVPESSFVYVVPYEPGEEFAAFIQKLYDASEEDTGVEVRDTDKIITFSTCSTTGNRTVIHAVLEDTYVY